MSHLKWNVEHDYAGKSSISRGRTYTGWIRSLAGCTSSRNQARFRLGQRLPVYPPFGASWQMAAGPCDTFPQTSLKFRTAGFPRYGFKPETSAATFAGSAGL